MTSLSILVPVYNEIKCLKEFTASLTKSFKDIDAEYIFINDGSTDGSAEWLKNFIDQNNNPKIKLINFLKNKGKGSAIKKGLEASSGDYILFQDSDLELDTKDSLEIYNIMVKDSKIECIFGSRYLSGKIKKNQNLLNEIFGRVNSIIFNLLFNQSLSDVHCGCKIISRNIKDKLNLTISDFGLEIDVASQIAKHKIEIYEYGISYFARNFEEGKKITWVDGLKSYYYLFKTRFIDNSFSTQISIIFTSIYMLYVGSHFGMGTGKNIFMIFMLFIGLFIGLHRKIINSLLIFIFIYLGSLFSQGNGKIYTVLMGFLIGMFVSKKISLYIKKNFKIKFLNSIF